MAISYEEVRYKNFGRCLRIENALIELFVTLDLGPRIIRYALRGGHNFFFEDKARNVLHDEKVMSDYYGRGAAWYIYGGHRIWTSPEALPRSYYPDNSHVAYEVKGNEFIFTPPPQRKNDIQMQLSITVYDENTNVTVKNRVRNLSKNDQTFAVWALTVLAPGGLEIFPMNTNDTGLLGNRMMALWPYTDMGDKRVAWGKQYVMLKQWKKAETAFKVGMSNARGWAAYIYHGAMFLKHFPYVENALYPDGGMNFETYTNDKFLEMESLSPLRKVSANKMIELVEQWNIIDGIRFSKLGDFETAQSIVSKYIE